MPFPADKIKPQTQEKNQFQVIQHLEMFVIKLCVSLIIFTSLCEETKAHKFTASVIYEKLSSPVLTEFENLIENDRTGKIKSMSVRKNKIEVLEENVFSNFSHLESLRLDENEIRSIKSNAFNNLQSLKSANFSNNDLQDLEYNIFVDIPKMTQLYFRKNSLKNFEQRWLGCIFTLEWLDLSYNLIDEISVGAFSYFSNLLHLNLAQNNIIFIQSDAFYGLDKLQMLDLSYNKIGQLDDHLFMPLDQLKILNLFYNELTYMSDKILTELEGLDELISLFNPLQCGCHEKLLDWADKNMVSINRNVYFRCLKIQELSEIPVCVKSGESYTTCLAEHSDNNMCDTLYNQIEDCKCIFDYDKYLLEKL